MRTHPQARSRALALSLLLVIAPLVPDAVAATEAFAISPQGIGPWKLGDARKSARKPPPGIALRSEGKRICAISTTRKADRTKEGLGVGSRFGDAEKAYGQAEVEAATGRLFFKGEAEAYDLSVRPMPASGLAKPAVDAMIVAFAVTRCEEEPE